jgi:sugar phosphate isomerase/epimerase
MGFDGIELPVRPGYQVEPENAAKLLPKAVDTLKKHGVETVSVAGASTESMIRACGEAGVPILRIMLQIPKDTDYLNCIDQARREWEALLPVLEASGVTLGIQNHKGRFLTHAMHLHHALLGYDPKHIGAVWDAAHNTFAGEEPELALDVVWPNLCLVNLKNGLWERKGVSESGVTQWRSRWVAGHEGICDWPRVMGELKRRGYTGDVCLTAEYTDKTPDEVEQLVKQDLKLAKRCFTSV